MQRFLILRCHPRDTLSIPSSFPHLDLLCPTSSLSVRRGPSRARHSILVPLLPSFLFLPISDLPLQSKTLPDLPPTLRSRLHLMQRPHAPPTHPHVFDLQNPLPPVIPRRRPQPYAYCTLDEINCMVTQSEALSTLLDDTPIRCGSIVEITQGLLEGIVGIVVQIKSNGDITLKIQQHLGWQINTCIVNVSVLRLLC